MTVETKFSIGQFVQLITDEENKKRLVVNFAVFGKEYIQYTLTCGLEVTQHSECEIKDYEPQPPQSNHKEIEGFRKEVKE